MKILSGDAAKKSRRPRTNPAHNEHRSAGRFGAGEEVQVRGVFCLDFFHRNPDTGDNRTVAEFRRGEDGVAENKQSKQRDDKLQSIGQRDGPHAADHCVDQSEPGGPVDSLLEWEVKVNVKDVTECGVLQSDP